MTLDPVKIGFIGAGNMAQAIGEGLIKKKMIEPSNLFVSARQENTLERWSSLKVNTTKNNIDIVRDADVIFLSVKPFQLDEALTSIKTDSNISHLNLTAKVFVSVLAGTTLKTLEVKLQEALSSDKVKIIRSMPNTPMMVAEGCAVLTPNAHVSQDDIDIVYKVFSVLGKCEVVPEYLISPFCGLCGSSPAYIYLVIEALSDGAVKKGIPREMATRFAAQAVKGAAQMVLETQKHPGQLKDDVCSPGGTTIAAIHALEKHGVRAAFMDAIEASVEKAEELGKE